MKNEGMMMTQTPFRLSFFGGGTDFPGYFNEYEGGVIATAIDKYLYVTINSLQRFYEKRVRLSYSKLEFVNDVKTLQHEIVRTILDHHPFFTDESCLDMHTFADLPASCGMGSSSAFTIGFLNALYALNGVYKTPEQMTYEAIDIEREKLQDAGGWQDQVTSAFGGFNYIRFKNKSFTVEPIAMSLENKQALEQACLLFFTGGTRSSSEIQKSVVNLTEEKIKQLNIIKQQTAAALDVLRQSNTARELIEEFGRLLNISWQAKRSLSANVSNNHIDQMYDKAMKAGAIGGKLCGAGGQGFLLVLVAPENKAKVVEALADFKYLDIRFDNAGSRLIYGQRRG